MFMAVMITKETGHKHFQTCELINESSESYHPPRKQKHKARAYSFNVMLYHKADITQSPCFTLKLCSYKVAINQKDINKTHIPMITKNA